MELKYLVLTILPLLLVIGMSDVFAQPEPYDQVNHFGVSTVDFADRLDFTYYDNIITGFILYDGIQNDFSIPVKFTLNGFIAGNDDILMKGYDLTKEHNVIIKLKGEKAILFQMTMPKEPIKVYEILKPIYKELPEIDDDKDQKILDEFNRYRNYTHIPSHDYSNEINVVKPEIDSFLMSINFVDLLDTINLNSELDLKVHVKNIRNNTSLDGADITIEIIDEDFVLFKWADVLNGGGYAYFDTDAIYPMFYPFHQYEVKAIVNYGNYTSTYSENFCIEVPDLEYWEENADLEYADSHKYDWLPYEYTVFPRESNSLDDCD